MPYTVKLCAACPYAPEWLGKHYDAASLIFCCIGCAHSGQTELRAPRGRKSHARRLSRSFVCVECAAKFLPWRKSQRLCSLACGYAARRRVLEARAA